jgi:oxygen-independent coproporphyrinogen-3 oxidase
MLSYACRHNLIYWRNDDYLGVGPGAHSHLRGVTEEGAPCERRWGNRKPVGGYINRIRKGAAVEEFREEIDPRLAMGETMMLGLRLLREGVLQARFAARHGQTVEAVFGNELHDLAARKLLTWDEDRVRLTPAGLLLGNRVFAAFLPN